MNRADLAEAEVAQCAFNGVAVFRRAGVLAGALAVFFAPGDPRALWDESVLPEDPLL